MKEIWKDIAGYEGYYQVSNLGEIRSLTRLVPTRREGFTANKYNGRYIRQKLSRHGYYDVSLMKDCKRKTFRVHRLVAIAFVPNDDPINKTQINHIDEVKTNNKATNLEWCDAKYNCNYGTRNERMGKNVSVSLKRNKSMCGENNPRYGLRGGLCPTAKKVYQYTEDMKLVKVWLSLIDTSLAGFSQQQVWRAATGRKESYAGFIWSYTEKTTENGKENN